jgi:hypothetical protein
MRRRRTSLPRRIIWRLRTQVKNTFYEKGTIAPYTKNGKKGLKFLYRQGTMPLYFVGCR